MYENYFLKKYMKNHKNNIFFFEQSRGEENNIRKAHTSTQFLFFKIFFFLNIGCWEI